MTDDNEKIEEWKYDFAWKQLENAQTRNNRLDNKAMGIINSSSLIISIITGILLFGIDKYKLITINEVGFYIGLIVMLIFAIILLLASIGYAFIAIRLKDQGIIYTKNNLIKLAPTELYKY